jgi:hypothetical protein
LPLFVLLGPDPADTRFKVPSCLVPETPVPLNAPRLLRYVGLEEWVELKACVEVVDVSLRLILAVEMFSLFSDCALICLKTET